MDKGGGCDSEVSDGWRVEGGVKNVEGLWGRY